MNTIEREHMHERRAIKRRGKIAAMTAVTDALGDLLKTYPPAMDLNESVDYALEGQAFIADVCTHIQSAAYELGRMIGQMAEGEDA